MKRHGRKATFIFKEMAHAKKVFVRQDTPTRALQTPYEGPYEVISRNDKTYKIRMNGRTVTVSIDRLKPTFILAEEVRFIYMTSRERQSKNKTQERDNSVVKRGKEQRKEARRSFIIKDILDFLDMVKKINKSACFIKIFIIYIIVGE